MQRFLESRSSSAVSHGRRFAVRAVWQTRRASVGSPAVPHAKDHRGRSPPKSGSANTRCRPPSTCSTAAPRVPFIARYRKEATGGLDDIQLRELEARLALPARAGRPPRGRAQEHRGAGQAHARAARRHRGRAHQAGAGRPVPAVQAQAPHQGPDRARSRHRAAGRQAVRRPDAGSRRRGRRPSSRPRRARAARTSPPCPPCSTACATSCPSAGPKTRRWCSRCANGCGPKACCKSKLAAGKDENNPDVAKFRDYFDYDEPIGRVPSHRALAVFRGRALEILDAKLVLPVEPEPGKPSHRRRQDRAAPGLEPPGPPGRRPAAQVRGLDLAREAVAVDRARPVRPPARRRREGRDQGVRRQPARPAAGRAGRPARGDGPGPRHPHRREGGGGRCHRQAGGHGHRLSARAAPRLGRLAAHAGAAVPQARREPDRHRQRHRQPRDRQAGRRPDASALATRACSAWW